MSKTNTIKAVIFDMDGLMIDSQRIAIEVWNDALAAYGYSMTTEDSLRLAGKNSSDVNQIILSIFGPDFPFETIRTHARQLFARHVDDKGIAIKPGLIKLLEFLDQKDILTAVATSTNRKDCIAHLDKCNLTRRFKTIVCGDDVTFGKPAPDIFLKTSDRIQVEPRCCVVLEDSSTGIRAAHSAGMIPIMVPDLLTPNDEIKSMAHIVVSSLIEAEAEIAKLI